MKNGHVINGKLMRSKENIFYFVIIILSLQLSRLIIGCGVVVTFLFGLCSVFLASILSGKSSKKNFWSYRKNICARILNGFVSFDFLKNKKQSIDFK